MSREITRWWWWGLLALLGTALLLLVWIAGSLSPPGIIFPRPFAVAVDDLGWIEGHNSGALDQVGPYRLGIKRRMQVSDYGPLVEIGREVGVRLQGAFILAEMDRENLLRSYPTTTAEGVEWDNTGNVGPAQLQVMAFLQEQAAYLEFGLHGVGHELWPEPGVRRRAEWYNLDEDRPWPQEVLSGHIEAVKGILAQYGLSTQDGHSFPESFVPGASGFHWNPRGEVSTGSLLRPEGVRFATTDFSYVEELGPPEGPNGGGVDHGLLVLNREEYGNIWYEMSSVPTTPIQDQESVVIETHWANFLAQDDFLQERATRAWIDFFRTVERQESRYLAKNTEQLASQWLYKEYAEVNEDRRGDVYIDNSAMPREVYEQELLGTLVLKIPLSEGRHVSRAELDGRPLAVYYEAGGFGFLDLPRLEAREYRLTYELGDRPLALFIDHAGTYNVYSTEAQADRFTFEARIYGTQEVMIRGISEPKSVVSGNPDLRLLATRYAADERLLVLTLQAHDIQGETGVVVVGF